MGRAVSAGVASSAASASPGRSIRATRGWPAARRSRGCWAGRASARRGEFAADESAIAVARPSPGFSRADSPFLARQGPSRNQGFVTLRALECSPLRTNPHPGDLALSGDRGRAATGGPARRENSATPILPDARCRRHAPLARSTRARRRGAPGIEEAKARAIAARSQGPRAAGISVRRTDGIGTCPEQGGLRESPPSAKGGQTSRLSGVRSTRVALVLRASRFSISPREP